MTESIHAPELAFRLARAIASDILLYHEEKVIKGIKDDTLWDIISDEIDEGRQLYKTRVSPELTESGNYFECALVDVILKKKGDQVSSSIW